MAAPVGKFYVLKYWFRISIVGIFCGICLAAYPVQPGNGYFTGVELQPIGNATINTVETEPAVVLVFAIDQKTADVTRRFNDWYNSPGRPDINAFAIGVDLANRSEDIVLEAINQRDLSMPVFLASADMLLGDDFRLMVLNNDRAVERFSTMDVAALNAGIARLGIDAPAATPAVAQAATPAVVPAEPETTPSVSVDADSGVLPDGTAYSTVTTTTRTETTRDSRVAGGESSNNIYENQNYGFSIEFPPLWQYQISARDDGAVAVEPPASQIDMRVWAIPADDVSNAQEYIDKRLETLAETNQTRVNVERRYIVRDDGHEGLDVTYSFTKPLDPDHIARGVLLYRGRIQVFVHDGYVKAASIQAPSGEFMATYPMVESFFRSFQIQPAGFNSPVL